MINSSLFHHRLILLVVLSFQIMFAQHRISFSVRDSVNNEHLIGASVLLGGTSNGAVTDAAGNAVLKKIPAGTHEFIFSAVGYTKRSVNVTIPTDDSTATVTVGLLQDDVEMEEVVVSSTRTNARIEDLPQKIEVLGTEEMMEESSLVPGSVASILGDIAIITIQRTNPVNGNDAIRMEGLDPQYTQIMRDGLPLYGGFSGSLGVLSIPPLDLKQVEIIKGSVSTLYGGGAIAGLINFISKTPGDSAEFTLLANTTTLRETNLDIFLSSKDESFGYTLFAAGTIKPYSDLNGDGFSEIPANNNYSLHPRFFFYDDGVPYFTFGITAGYDERESGDLSALRNGMTDAHWFLQKERSYRITADAQFNDRISDVHSLTIKSSGGYFRRTLNQSAFHFTGTQYSSYSEASDLICSGRHDIVAGFTVSTESFRKYGPDIIPLPQYDHGSMGLFVQDDWHLTDELIVESGVRFDRTTADGNFILPRVSFFYKANNRTSVRFAAGTGYVVPNILAVEDPSPTLYPNARSVSAEHSYGINADVNHHLLLFDDIDIEVNQAFYFTSIADPLVADIDSLNRTTLVTGANSAESYGSDTYLRMMFDHWELYVGYNHTEALLLLPAGNIPMPFNPKDKFSVTLAVTLSDEWRTGVEGAYTANQFVEKRRRVPDFWFFAAMAERKFPFGRIVLNCENLFDSRQSKHEALVTNASSLSGPVFSPLWGPVEGRVANLSLKLDL